MRAALSLVTVLALTGCAGWPDFTITGTVVDRQFEPAELDTKRKCTTKTVDGKSKQVCQKKQEWDPAEWSLTVKDDKGRTHTVDVTGPEYEAHPIGSAYTNG